MKIIAIMIPAEFKIWQNLAKREFNTREIQNILFLAKGFRKIVFYPWKITILGKILGNLR